MQNRYGPWATMIDLGGSPQLSTFWRRRLTMLASASRTSLVLSRSNLLCLGAAALLMLLLPTVRFAAAAADEEKAPDAGTPSAVEQTGQESATKKGTVGGKQPVNSFSGTTNVYVGTTVVSNANIFLPVQVYHDLNDEGTRNALKLTDSQVKQLRAVSRDFSQRQRDAAKEMRKAMETPSPEQRAAAFREFDMKLAQEKRVIRKQVEKLLTSQQLHTLRTLAVGSQCVGRFPYDRQLAEAIGLSKAQKKELRSRLLESEAFQERQRRLDGALRENQNKTLAVITPTQWTEIPKLIGKDGHEHPGQEMRQLANPLVSEQLALTAEQKQKMPGIFATSAAEQGKLSKLGEEANRAHSTKDMTAKWAELDRKLQELQKHDRAQIEALLTKPQLAVFDKLFLQQEFLNLLHTSRILAGFNQSNNESSLFDDIHATAEQKKELRRLEDEADGLVRQWYLEIGATVLQILSPQQEDKLIDALDRPPEPLNVQSAAGKEGKQGMSRADDIFVLAGPEESDAKGGVKKPADSAKPAKTK